VNRREFLSHCVSAGIAIGMGNLASCIGPKISLASADKAQLNGLRIADAHAHPYQFYGSSAYDKSTPTIEMMKQLGIVASSFSAVGDRLKIKRMPKKPFYDTLNQLKTVIKFEEKKKVLIIRRASDVPLSIGPDNSPGAIMAIEGGDSLEGKIYNLDEFYKYGVRMITLLHQHNNEIGFNQDSQSDGPLKPFGIQVIERMNELGIIIDVAHAKTQTLKGIAKISAAPLVDSHTSLHPLDKPSKPTRLRTWEEMEIVAKTGGVICTWPLAYRKYKRNTLRHWAEEIIKMKERLGIKHIGLGTDSGGKLPQQVKGWRSIMSLPKLIEAMRDVGLSQNDIADYVGGNFLRVVNKCLS
jgi:membrane dipeptidase